MTAIVPIPSDEIREAVDLPLDPRQAVHVRHDDLAALVAEVEALRVIVRLVDEHLCDTSLVADLASEVDTFDPDVIRRALQNGSQYD